MRGQGQFVTFLYGQKSNQKTHSQRIFLTPFVLVARRKIKLALASLGLKQNFAFSLAPSQKAKNSNGCLILINPFRFFRDLTSERGKTRLTAVREQILSLSTLHVGRINLFPSERSQMPAPSS